MGPFDPNLGQYVIIGKGTNTGLAYGKARTEADKRCSGYEILKVRFTQLPKRWQATITIDCPPN